MILFNATSRRACALSDDKLTTGSVGIQVEFTFSDDWAAAPARIAVFRGSGQSVDVALLEDRCTVPPEVLTQPGSTLTIGVYGTDAERTVVIPTVYAEAGQIKRGTEPSGVEPTPETQPLIDQLLAAAKAARDAADEAERLAKSVKDAADAGEFDGAPGAAGSGVWYTTARVSASSGNPFVRRRDLIGREGATVQVHDLLVAPDVGDEGEPTTLYEITSVGTACALKRLCKMQGEDGTSPTVAITEITGGHRITITDEAHPDGQSFDVMDGSGGVGTIDSDFSTTSENPVQNKVITAAFNTALQQLQALGLALDDKVNKVSGKGLSTNDFTDSDKAKLDDAATEQWVTQQGYITDAALGVYRTAQAQDVIDQQQNTAIAAKYTKPSGGIPKTDLAAAVQTSLGKADTALQTAPVTSVNGQTGTVTLSIPSTASDVGAVASNQGSANANKVLTVSSSGVVVPEDNRFVVTLTPTAQDFSGTMDKTVGEINTAYEAGKKIVFKVLSGVNEATYADCSMQHASGSHTYPSFNGFIISDMVTPNLLIFAFTGYTDDGTRATYATHIYPLASGQWTGGSY